jgi:hypothetical protein
MPGTSPRASGWSPAQLLALVIGALYVVIGLAGFFVTGFSGFVDPDGELLLGIFQVNPAHNVVHLLIGVAGLGLATTLVRARIYGWLLAVGYGAAFVYGLFFATTDHAANFLALNQADNVLHVASVVVGLVIVFWASHDLGDLRVGSREEARARR